MKRSYEIVYILPTNLNETDQKSTEQKVTEWLTSNGGEIKNSSHWGRRRLAYPIGQNREGYYIFLEADLDSAQVKDFERRMSLEPNVVRHLVVRPEE